MKPRLIRPFVACLTVACLWSPPTLGQQRAAAEAIFRSGRQAAARGDWVTACERFAISNRLEPAPGTLLNLARCEEMLGRLVTAWERYMEAMHQFSSDDPRRQVAAERARALEDRLPYLTVTLPGPLAGAQVRQNGRLLPVPLLGIALPVDPGPVELILEVPGRTPSRVQLMIHEAEHVIRRLEPGPPLEVAAQDTAAGGVDSDGAPDSLAVERSGPERSSASAPQLGAPARESPRAWLAETQPPIPAASRGPARPQETPAAGDGATRAPGPVDPVPAETKTPWAYAAVGLGAAGLVTGLFTGLHALEAKRVVDRECQGQVCSERGLGAAQRGSEAAQISTISMAAGGVSLGVGLWLLLMNNGSSGPRLAVQPTAKGAQFQFSGAL
jgi:hypothetical protein